MLLVSTMIDQSIILMLMFTAFQLCCSVTVQLTSIREHLLM